MFRALYIYVMFMLMHMEYMYTCVYVMRSIYLLNFMETNQALSVSCGLAVASRRYAVSRSNEQASARFLVLHPGFAGWGGERTAACCAIGSFL